MPAYYPIFRANGELGALDLYRQRRYYKNKTKKLFEDPGGLGSNFIDLWYDVPFYGKVNPQGRLVVVDQTFLQYSGRDATILLNFVFAAFEDFKSYMNRAGAHGKSDLATAFKNFNPKQSFIDPVGQYMMYGLNIILNFNENILATSSRGGRQIVPTFASYISQFLKYFGTISNVFSFSGYFASSEVGIGSTGLALSLLDQDADNDFLKNKIFKNAEFYKYTRAAAKFGFRVDKNAPWTLVADLKSQPMQKYLVQKNIQNINVLFANYFNSAAEHDVTLTALLLYEGYTRYQKNRYFEVKTFHCVQPPPRFNEAMSTNVISKTKKIFSQELSFTDFLASVQDRKRLMLALQKIKYIETHQKADELYFNFYAKFRQAVLAEDYDIATNMLESYYNPARIYRHFNSKVPHYFEKSKKGHPTPDLIKKKMLTYKENLSTIYNTAVSVPDLTKPGMSGY